MNNQLKKLVADFGGTHLRIGISNGLEINNISKIRYDNEASSIKLISNYINDFKDIDQIRICAAGPIENEKIEITNSNLVISKKEISEFSKIDDVAIFNDAEAACNYLPVIKKESYKTVNYGKSLNNNFAYIALGTGLGVSGVQKLKNKSVVFSGEGGYCHIPYTENDTISRDVINIIQNDYPRISSERLISGPGLSLIFKALCLLKDYKSNLSSEEIVLNAVKNKKGFEYDACKILFELLGKFSASIALVYGARGGVFLSGGLLERLFPILPNDLLLKNFLINGRMQEYVNNIPLHIINDDLVSLKGCATYQE